MDTFGTIQAFPAAGVLTNAFTALKQTVVSSIVVCNQSVTPTNFRISLAVAGAADTPAQYLYYDTELPGSDTGPFVATIGVSFAIGTVIRVRSDNGAVSFNLFVVEVS